MSCSTSSISDSIGTLLHFSAYSSHLAAATDDEDWGYDDNYDGEDVADMDIGMDKDCLLYTSDAADE